MRNGAADPARPARFQLRLPSPVWPFSGRLVDSRLHESHRTNEIAGMTSVLVEPVTLHSDARGSVYEPLGPDGLPAQRNVHVVLTEPGHVRANHRHPRGTEVMTVHGPALVRMREDGRDTDTEVPAGAVYRFTIPPGVAHAVRNTGDAPALIVSFNTVAHDPADPDVVRETILEP